MNQWPDDNDGDPLLDSCLSELLGDQSPPDLTVRILAAWEASQAVPPGRAREAATAAGKAAANGHSHVALEGPPAGPSSRASVFWQAVLSVAVVLLLGVGLGVLALKWTARSRGTIDPQGTARAPAPPNASADPDAGPPAAPRVPDTQLVHPRRSPVDLELPFPSTPSAAPTGVEITGAQWPDPLPDAQIVSEIESLIRAGWQTAGLQASPPASDDAWCRRVYVRLLGRIPTVDELQRFAADTSRDKRATLVDTLIHGSAYADEFASHWASNWTNVLIGRTGGTRAQDAASREGLFVYLRDAIREDRSFRDVTEELIAASGGSRVGDKNFNGATNFLLAHSSENQSTATGVISRVFLGQRFQCAQCHDHPSNSALTQRTFWELNAFLRQSVAVRDQGSVMLVDRDMPEEAVFFEQLDGVKRAVLPVLPDGTRVPPSGKVEEVQRRQILASWVSASADMPRAIVDRTWAHFFGYGLTNPVDDAGPNNPPSHPQLREQLAEQFAAHDYNLRKLMRWIVLSDPFLRSSRITEHNLADRPEQGELPWFSRYYARQMQPEAVFDSLRLVADARRKSGGAEPARADFLGQFSVPMDNDEGEESHLFRGDIRQSVLLMTGPLMQRAVNSDEGAVLRMVEASNMSLEEKVTHLFLAAVSRHPDRRELELAVAMIRGSEKPETALQDIWWALLNSSEFILDH